MSRQLFILTLSIAATVSNCFSQDLLSVDWQKIVCTDYYIDHVYSICNDKNGNTYTLGSFENEAICLGENVKESTGHYFLTKQNLKGDKLFAKNLGGTESFTFGDIKVCDNGDLVLGLCFKSTFFLNGDSITTSETWSSIILKLDQNLNLKWFKAFPSTHNTYTTRILLDSDENIYTSILFLGTLSINGTTYSRGEGYAAVIAKINSEGDILWTHHYYSDYFVSDIVVKIRTICNSCPSTLFISGRVNGDSILIDGVLKAQQKIKSSNQYFVSTLNEHGDILQTKFLDQGIQSIADIGFYQNRIFIAGHFRDTVKWNGTYVAPLDFSSIYIGELNAQADLIGFTDLQSSKTVYLTGFKISPQFGFLLSGIFDGSFSLQSSSVTLATEFDRGSFIASINDTLKLNDFKYIKGGSYNLRYLSIFNNQITGTAMFERTCNFQNQSCFAMNYDISTFQTTDIKQLATFNPPVFPKTEIPVSFSAQVYPNPFATSFQIKFSEPIYSTSVTMTNAIGQVCKDIVVSQINDTEITIETKGLSAGLYIVQCQTCNNYKATHKLIKL